METYPFRSSFAYQTSLMQGLRILQVRHVYQQAKMEDDDLTTIGMINIILVLVLLIL